MKNKKSRKKLMALVLCVYLLIVGVVSIAPLIPPSTPAFLDDSMFSVDNAFNHIEQIAIEPHPIGTKAIQRVKEYITSQLLELGLEPEIQTIIESNYFSFAGENIEIVNIVARIPGTSPSKAIAIVGHYDTFTHSPGANDNSSGVAIILETARAIQAGSKLKNDLILIFTDGEEPAPRFGSSAFIKEHPWASDIGFVINLEAIGTGGYSTITEMNGPSKWVVDQYAASVPYPVAFSFITATTELIGGSNTDFSEFRDASINGVGFTYLHGSSIYHTMADVPERVSLPSLNQQGSNTLALTRQMGNLDLIQSPNDSNALYFTVGRTNVVRYNMTWAYPLVLLSGALLIFIALQQRELWRQILRSFGITLLTIVIVAMILVGIWTMLANWHEMMGVTESYLYLVGMILMTSIIGTLINRLTRRNVDLAPDSIGVLLVWWIFGLLTTIVAPGMSYLFVLPALTGGLVMRLRVPKIASRWIYYVGYLIATGTTLVLVIPAIDLFYQFAQPRSGNPGSQILSVIVIPAMLMVMVFELIRVLYVKPEMDTVSQE